MLSFGRSCVRAGTPRGKTSLITTFSGVLLTVGLAGCSTLPTSGPSASGILRDKDAAKLMGFVIANIDTPTSVASANMLPTSPPSLALLASEGRVDTVGPGDVLSVSIYEVGTGLFSGGVTSLGNEAVFNASARGEGVAGVVVDRDGAITLPYIGRIVVAGETPTEIQAKIQKGLRGLSQSPQALVSVRQNISNTVMVLGVVEKPGRQDLTLARQRVLDSIAMAGGTGMQAQEDMVVRVTRHGKSAEQLLSSVRAGSPEDLLLLPGDRIQVIRRPQSYSVFGAAKVSQINFENPSLTLAEALARAGGPIDERADASAIFIFRYTRGSDGKPLMPEGNLDGAVRPPMIYRLDLMKPTSYFLAQQFLMRDKDVVYFANAKANRPAKFVAIINQLFSPAVAVRAISN